MSRRTETSAGLLAFRRNSSLEILLAHPGGPYWVRKDAGAWTIPKGLVEPGQTLLATALREFFEETGLPVDGEVFPLASVRQKSGKRVHAFAVEADLDIANFKSNIGEIEWPPRSGKKLRIPEVDRIAYFGLDEARVKIIAYQRPFLDALLKKLGG